MRICNRSLAGPWRNCKRYDESMTWNVTGIRYSEWLNVVVLLIWKIVPAIAKRETNITIGTLAHHLHAPWMIREQTPMDNPRTNWNITRQKQSRELIYCKNPLGKLCKAQPFNHTPSQTSIPCKGTPVLRIRKRPFMMPNVHSTSFRRLSNHLLNRIWG